MIRLENIRKKLSHRGKTTIVAAPDITVADGGCAGLIGPNGVGKTTLLRIAAGVIQIDAGCVAIDRPLIAFTDIERQLKHRLLPHENIQYLAALFAMETVGKSAIGDCLDRVGLAERKNSFIGKLSKGQKTRLVMAVIMACPSVRSIVLDEPTNGLDMNGEQLVRQTMAEAMARGVSVLISSHNLTLIQTVCEKIYAGDKNAGTAEHVFVRYDKTSATLTRGFNVSLHDGSDHIVQKNELVAFMKSHLDTIENISPGGIEIERS
ncbi:MAG: ATP-binding cassette domain-containing protein [Hyphomicrobiales bacterium]